MQAVATAVRTAAATAVAASGMMGMHALARKMFFEKSAKVRRASRFSASIAVGGISRRRAAFFAGAAPAGDVGGSRSGDGAVTWVGADGAVTTEGRGVLSGCGCFACKASSILRA